MFCKPSLIVIVTVLGLCLKATVVDAMGFDSLSGPFDYDDEKTTKKTTTTTTTTTTKPTTTTTRRTTTTRPTTTTRLPWPQPNLSAHGLPCRTSCDVWPGTKCNICWTTIPTKWGSNWDYCSPESGKDYQRRECLNSCTRYNGNEYTSCRISTGEYSKCSNPAQATTRILTPTTTTTTPTTTTSRLPQPQPNLSAHGLPCRTSCDVWPGTKCNVCWTTIPTTRGRNWDYCSPESGKDYQRRACLNSCTRYNGNQYTSCRISTGEYSKCSNPAKGTTRYGRQISTSVVSPYDPFF